MSLIYAEGFDRHPLGQVLSSGPGSLNKALEPRNINVLTPPSDQPVVTYVTALGRNWLRGYDSTGVWSKTSQLYIQLGAVITDALNEARRVGPGLPATPAPSRYIYQWKVSQGAGNTVGPANTTANFGTFGTQELTFGFIAGYVMPTKGYWQMELVYDIAIKRLRWYMDGVLRGTWIVNGSTLKINMAGLSRYVTSGTNPSLPCFITDILVIYDDGIWPSVPLGEVSVRDVLMELVTPAHADAVVVDGQDITNALMKSAPAGLKLVAADTNAVYKPAEAQAALSADNVCAFVVDTTRAVGAVAGDLDVTIKTANGSTSLKESPTTTNLTNLRSVIRVPTKAMTVQAMKDNLRVDLACRAR